MKHSITLLQESIKDPTHHALTLRQDDETGELDVYCVIHDSYIVSFAEDGMYGYIENCLGIAECTMFYGECCQSEP